MPQTKPRSTKSKSSQPAQKTSKRINQAVEESKEKGKQIVNEVVEETKEKGKQIVNEVVEETKEKGKQIVNEAKEETSQLINETKQETSKMAKRQLKNVAHQIDGVANALVKTADSIEDDQTWIADGARQTAQALEKMSGSLRENEFGKLVRNFEDYARQQPMVVLGGAAIAGYFLVKFLKSSSDHIEEADSTIDD